MSFKVASAATALLGTAMAAQKINYTLTGYNDLAITPQMGWDNWNALGCDVSEDLLLDTANKMVHIGLRDVGYNYVILDDCWNTGRYENGSLRPDADKFPKGIKHVSDAVHALDMKFGMYSSAGHFTCGKYTGSLNYEEIDAQTWADWGVDYLKYDNCYNGGQSGTADISFTRYDKMAKALNATGRDIHYGMCNWGQDRPWDWAMTIANSWRATGDITDSFNRPDPRCPCEDEDGINCAFPGYHCSVMNIVNKVVSFIHRSQPGAWNDLDMLEVGNGMQEDSEYVVHMTLWAALKSPLIMGNDIRIIDAPSYSILTNPAILALSQDPLGSSAQRIWRYHVYPDQYGQGDIQLWSGPLAQGDQVVLLLNAANQDLYMNATLAEIFVDQGGAKSDEAQSDWDVYDLWANRMPDAKANEILAANSTEGVAGLEQWYYNSTAMSYEDGIFANHTLLMGTHVDSVPAGGKVSALVPRHSIKAYRLRMAGSPVTKVKRDEL